MIMPMRLDGLLFMLVSLATAALGGVGLIAQSLVILGVRYGMIEAGARTPWWRDLGRGVLGPLACVLVGGVTAAIYIGWIDGSSGDLERTLDELAALVPIAAIAAWIATHVLFARATRHALR